MENKSCIGIISWFSDNEYRQERVIRCKKLIEKCDEIFSIPIIIIAQNWKDEIGSKNIIKLQYPKLGITKARQVLWDYFKNSSFDWLICFDDDGELEGSKQDGDKLIKFLKTINDGYLYSRKNEFKLCAFHKNIANILEIPDLDVESGTGIEDYGFFRILEIKYPEKKIAYKWGTLKDTRHWQNDKTTTWQRQNISKLIQKTNEYIKKEIK